MRGFFVIIEIELFFVPKIRWCAQNSETTLCVKILHKL